MYDMNRKLTMQKENAHITICTTIYPLILNVCKIQEDKLMVSGLGVHRGLGYKEA